VSPDVLGPIVTFGDCCAAGGRCPRTSGAGACGTAPLSVVAGAGCEVPSRCAGGALVWAWMSTTKRPRTRAKP